MWHKKINLFYFANKWQSQLYRPIKTWNLIYFIFYLNFINIYTSKGIFCWTLKKKKNSFTIQTKLKYLLDLENCKSNYKKHNAAGTIILSKLIYIFLLLAKIYKMILQNDINNSFINKYT